MGFSSRPLVLALMLPLSWGVVSAKDCPENTGPTTIEEHRFDGPLPMTGYPSIKTIISSWASSKVKNELVKDEYETTSEFEKRKAEFSRRYEETAIAYVPLRFSYDADLEHYVVDTCVNEEIPQDDLLGQTLGLSADNARRRVYVRTPRCEENIIPMNLMKAREIRDVAQVLGVLSFPHDRTPTYPGQLTSFLSEDPDNAGTVFELLEADLRFIILGRIDTREILTYRKMPQPCLETIEEHKSVKIVAPIYPRRALVRGTTGYCVVEYTVTTTGKIRDPFPTDCWPKNTFEEASINAALQFIYKPKLVDGVPVEVTGIQHKFTYAIDQ